VTNKHCRARADVIHRPRQRRLTLTLHKRSAGNPIREQAQAATSTADAIVL